MVHKKSMYRLSFKNIDNDQRKSIWIENSLLRESRRHNEMSHHSIYEEMSNCECDESDGSENNDNETLLQTLSVNEAKCTDTSSLQSSKKRINSPKRPSSCHQNYLLPNPNRPMGVLKFSNIDREYDLIPSVGENIPSTSRIGSAFGRSRSMHTLCDKGVINIRPVTRRVFQSEKYHGKEPSRMRSRSTDPIFTTTEPVFRTANVVKSRRKTPITAGKELHYTSECKHCGKSTYHRGIII